MYQTRLAGRLWIRDETEERLEEDVHTPAVVAVESEAMTEQFARPDEDPVV